MENKINIAELLRDCPQGMELDCTIWDSEARVFFQRVLDSNFAYPIEAIVKYNNKEYPASFNKYGAFNAQPYCKCVIFPKGKTTWEGFVPSYQFKDGDIVFYDNCVSIFKEWGDETLFRNYVKVDIDGIHPMLCDKTHSNGKSIKREARFATEEEKQKLFDAIKAKGYCWNGETKTLEELLKFKDGDILTTNLGSVFILKEPNEDVLCYSCYVALNDVSRFITSYTKFCIKNGCRLATEEEKQKLFDAIKANGYHWNPETKKLEKLVEPKFKVGDRITNGKISITIGYIDNEYYYEISRNIANRLFIKNQDEWNLVPNKFDINTLIPFESRVLVRNKNHYKWEGAVFGRHDGNTFFTIGGADWRFCIPYKDNEHLFGNINDCNDFYKIWEK